MRPGRPRPRRAIAVEEDRQHRESSVSHDLPMLPDGLLQAPFRPNFHRFRKPAEGDERRGKMSAARRPIALD